MDYLKIYRESNKKYYKFYLEWNTGDMYWDNTPDDETFYGTIDELKEHLDCEIPSDFEEQLLTGDKIYDDGGETWCAQIAEEVSYEDCIEWREEQEAKRKREEEEKERKEQERKENNWTSKEEAIEAIQHLINASSFTQASPTKNHPDRVVHYKNCGLRLETSSDFYFTHTNYFVRVSTSPYWIDKNIKKVLNIGIKMFFFIFKSDH